MTEIMIDLQGGAKAPLYEKIYDYIKNEITIGKMITGEKLPSTRQLAKHLLVSRSTVEMAYEQLLAEGYIKAEPCRGFFICDVTELYNIGMGTKLTVDSKNAAEKSGQNLRKLHTGKEKQPLQPLEAEGAAIQIDFSPYAIDTEHFPFNIWRKIQKNALLDDREELLLPGDGQGDYGLRCAIAAYLHQARGVNCAPDAIIIGAGNEYLEILLTQILGKGKKVLMENPTYLQAYHTFLNMGYEMEMLSVKTQGIQAGDVRKKNADIVYVMPSHQFPLGTVMPLKQRLELLKWASESEERYIIEDDHDSEYRYRGKPIPSLQSVDYFGKVIYLGTFSKSIAPSTRISYMVLPPQLLERYYQYCGFYSSTVSKLQQDILTTFIREGHFERHLNKMRGIYRAKHDFLLGELKKRNWVKTIRGEHAGLHVLVEVETDMPEWEICRKAGRSGVRVYGISEYYVPEKTVAGEHSTGEHCDSACAAVLLLGYGRLTENEMLAGLEVLDKLLEQG